MFVVVLASEICVFSARAYDLTKEVRKAADRAKSRLCLKTLNIVSDAEKNADKNVFFSDDQRHEINTSAQVHISKHSLSINSYIG